MVKSKSETPSHFMGKELGSYFKTHRNKVNLSQGYVGKYLGYKTPQFISNFERGLCMLPLKKVYTLIELYDMDGEEVAGMIIRLQEQLVRQELKLKEKTG